MDPDKEIPVDLTRAQEERFAAVWPHFSRSAFYKSKLALVDEVSGLADLASLPFTTKEELRNALPMERAAVDRRDIAYYFASSGTTGVPTISVWSDHDTEILRTVAIRAMSSLGVGDEDTAMLVAPMGPSIMWFCMMQQFNAVGCGVYPVGTPPPEIILRALSELPISVAISLPSTFTRLADFLAAGGAPRPRWDNLRQLQCGGDVLTDARRRRIEEFWQAECFNLLGLSEVFGPIAYECRERTGLHLASDLVYVEVVDPETRQAVPTGQDGVAVYTTLWPKASPLLRYWSDDFVRLDMAPCACGRPGPRLTYLGRPLDMAWMGGRRVFAGEIEQIVLSYPVGNEFALVLSDDGVVLQVEAIPGHPIPVDALVDQVGETIGYPVRPQVMPPGALPRDVPKAIRIVDHRSDVHVRSQR